MRKRTRARECALQMLYQIDLRKENVQEIIKGYWQSQESDEEVTSFANQLVLGTIKMLSEIDEKISKHADNWDLKRMAVVDRNILRLATFELSHRDDIPPKVCMNEAVELAKRFGDTESAKFINGVLDAIHKQSSAKDQSSSGERSDSSKKEE